MIPWWQWMKIIFPIVFAKRNRVLIVITTPGNTTVSGESLFKKLITLKMTIGGVEEKIFGSWQMFGVCGDCMKSGRAELCTHQKTKPEWRCDKGAQAAKIIYDETGCGDDYAAEMGGHESGSRCQTTNVFNSEMVERILTLTPDKNEYSNQSLTPKVIICGFDAHGGGASESAFVAYYFSEKGVVHVSVSCFYYHHHHHHSMMLYFAFKASQLV